jgi:hypothetical protein
VVCPGCASRPALPITLPWLVAGDFNEIMYSHEKEGGNVRPQRCMQAFRDCLTACDDLGISGDIFTWIRGRIREQLDRAVGNPGWVSFVPCIRSGERRFW